MMRFLNDNEIRNWNLIADHCDEIEELTAIQKLVTKRSFRFLQQEFGDNFLHTTTLDHPFFSYLSNYAPYTRSWFIDLANSLYKLKHSPNYESLIKRLKDSRKFPEAISVLETAYKFLQTGFEIEFDPLLVVQGKEKTPDLKLINKASGEILYCEVSISNSSEIQLKAQQTEMELSRILISKFSLEFAGKVHRILSKNHMIELSGKINRLVKSISESLGFGELIIEGIITLGISTHENVDKLIKWAELHNCNFRCFDGPPFDVNELQRIEFKIKKEQQQLPTTIPNIIVIYDTDFFYSLKDLQHTVEDLEESIFDIKNVMYIIIRGEYVGSIEPMSQRYGDHLYIQKSRYGVIAEQYLILNNRFCEFKFTPNTKLMIEQSYT